MKAAPLDGIRVLDLGDESVRLATRILADLGADVILVEPPGGSRARGLAPRLDGLSPEHAAEASLVHQYGNAGKRSIVLDVATRDGKGQLSRMAADADVLVETGAPGRPLWLDELGLGYRALRARNPSLVFASVTPFGRSGPWRDWRASDLVCGAAGGLVWVSGERSDPPLHGAASPSHSMGSLVAATGVLVALAARDRDPERRGVQLDVSLQEATTMAVLQTANPSWWAWHGFAPGRPGLSIALQCRDGGWVSFVTRPDRIRNFIAWLDDVGVQHALTPDDWPHARIGAPYRGNPVVHAIRALLDALPRDEFIAGAFASDQIALPVTDFPMMERHEHFLANDQFFEVKHEGLGRSLGFVRSPVDAIGDVRVRRAPTLDEHADAIRAALREPPAKAAADDGRCCDPRQALAGVRVVDLCWVLAGPLGGRILANFGAEVIKLESSRRPDGMRQQAGPDGQLDTDVGALFNDANTGKLSLTLDLADPRGREVALRLVAKSDVVTSNYRPGALERMGFAYADLVAVRPDVILVSMPGTHSRGVWSPRSTLGNTVMSGSGFNPLMGFPGRAPRGIGVAYPDFTSPYLVATMVMAALRARDAGGGGRHLDVSQLSGTISLLGVDWMHYRATGVQPPPSQNRSPNHCPHGVFPASGEDDWCAIAVESDDQWRALCGAMGEPRLADDPRFATFAARKANEPEVEERLAGWTRRQDRWALAERLQSLGVPAAPVENLRDTFERDPQLRQHYQRVAQPSRPDVEIPIDGEAIRFAGVEHRLRRAPMLGEHSEQVLREIVGLAREELDALLLAGVVA